VRIGFFGDKLIKQAHNPIKDGHKQIKQTDNLIKEWFIWNILYSERKSSGGAQSFGRGFADASWQPLSRGTLIQHPSTTLFFVKKTDGLVATIIVKCA